MKRTLLFVVPLVLAAAGAAGFALANPPAGASTPSSAVARGRYIVEAFGCTDCHTPMTMGPDGPGRDLAHAFSGHPESLAMPPAPDLGDPRWMGAVSATMTAWSGPWGVSYTSNLTPDEETGLGRWSEGTFLQAVRTGRHMGVGRPILPPMPIDQLAKLTDEDLRAIFAYLKSLPPVHNRVPEPTSPAAKQAR